MIGRVATLLSLALLAACQRGDEIEGHADLVEQVENHPVGMGQDQWIEMVNGAGERERTGLIFGYLDDYGECLKAIDGLKAANPGRQYRCVPAN